MKTYLIFSFLVIFLLSSCSSHPVLPEAKDVTVSREEPDEECKNLGPVQGTVQTKNGTPEQALEDMKKDAARKGANYIRMEAQSAYGTSTRGTAYFCP